VSEICVDHQNGETTYNGYASAYQAMWECEKEFRQQDFAARMGIVAELMVELDNYIPRELKYHFDKGTHMLSCLVLDDEDNVIMKHRGVDLPPFMKNEFDIVGVHTFLVYQDKIHPEDKIVIGDWSKS